MLGCIHIDLKMKIMTSFSFYRGDPNLRNDKKKMHKYFQEKFDEFDSNILRNNSKYFKALFKILNISMGYPFSHPFTD